MNGVQRRRLSNLSISEALCRKVKQDKRTGQLFCSKKTRGTSEDINVYEVFDLHDMPGIESQRRSPIFHSPLY